MHGNITVESKTKQLDQDGNIKSSVHVTRSTTPGERLKAIDIANKIEGVYQENEFSGKTVSRELKDLYTRFMPEMHKKA